MGAGLARLDGYPFEVRYSTGALARARAAAEIAADAYVYLWQNASGSGVGDSSSVSGSSADNSGHRPGPAVCKVTPTDEPEVTGTVPPAGVDVTSGLNLLVHSVDTPTTVASPVRLRGVTVPWPELGSSAWVRAGSGWPLRRADRLDQPLHLVTSGPEPLSLPEHSRGADTRGSTRHPLSGAADAPPAGRGRRGHYRGKGRRGEEC